MGCGGSAKPTSNTVHQVQKKTADVVPRAAHRRPPPNPRFKLEPEVLDGFAKILKRFYEPPSTQRKLEETAPKPVPQYKPPPIANPFGDLLKGEQEKVQKQSEMQRRAEGTGEKRYSPEPPRPENDSDDEKEVIEDETARLARAESDRRAKEEADRLAKKKREEEEKLAAGRKGLISGMENEATSIVSKYT